MFENLVRKEILSFTPYIPGKPISALKRELRLHKVVKLASNENPIGPSLTAVRTLTRLLPRLLMYYPESNCPDLRTALADKLQIPAENFVFGNGSDEIIELLGKVFLNSQDEIIVSSHAFIRYRMAGELMGCRVKTIPMKNFKHDIIAMGTQVSTKTKLVFIANPNNPTGTYNSKAEVETFLGLLKRKRYRGIVVFDEAYYEYARCESDYPESIKYIIQFPGLMVLRTFSKIYALAGLRIGYGIAHPEIIRYLDRIRPPFNVNSLAQVAAVVSLNDKKQLTQSITLIQKEKQRLYTELDRLGLSYLNSAANFVLIKLPVKGNLIFRQLLNYGVIVRAMDEYDLPDFIRVTIGLPNQNRMFIRRLNQVLGR